MSQHGAPPRRPPACPSVGILARLPASACAAAVKTSRAWPCGARTLVAAALALAPVATIACAGTTSSPPASAPAPVEPLHTMPPPASTRLSPVALLQRGIDSMVAQPEFRNANWGVLIVDPAAGDTLYSHGAGKLFMPASNMKIVTGAVALAQLGADFHFRTTLIAHGTVCDGVVHGDLAVDGRGDPTVSDAMQGDAMAPLRQMADSLAARGITRITGYVVPGDDVFPDSSLGFGWSWDDLAEPYSAGVDELFFNEGFARVVVRGARRAGRPATATVFPGSRYPTLHVTARTSPPPPPLGALGSGGTPPRAIGQTADLSTSVDRITGAVVISGWIAPRVVDTVSIVFPDQRAAYVAAFGEALAARGIRVQRLARPGRPCRGGARPATTDTLVVYQSPPLRDVLRAMEKPSQNQIAEILLHTLGLERTGVGRADSGAAVVARQLIQWGAQPDGFVIRDGSGLSRYDYVTPETLVHVLAAMRHDTAFTAFYDALPIAGVDGTIANRMKGTPAQGNVHAKTGFVANARSLSGYVTTAGGRLLIFSALCNNWTVPVSDVERVQDAIAERLAALAGDGGASGGATGTTRETGGAGGSGGFGGRPAGDHAGDRDGGAP